MTSLSPCSPSTKASTAPGAIPSDLRHRVGGVRRYDEDAVETRRHRLADAIAHDRRALAGNCRARLPVLRGRTCGDDEDGRIAHIRIVATPDPGRTRNRVGVGNVGRFGSRTVGIRIDQDDFGNQPTQHQRVGRCSPDITGADNGDT
jgi:hypothetical protein